MAGYAPISLQQRSGIDGKPFPGAKAYFYASETLTALTTYTDYSLAVAHPNPVVTNAYGVFPAIFLSEASLFYRLRVTTAEGVILDDLVTLPVIGPVGGGSTPAPIDPTGVRQTGDIDPQPYAGARNGYVRANGRTIGSALSGATERANADCESLYLIYWGRYSDTICPVTGGRGLSAAADWAAAKPMGLPDWRGSQFIAMDGMGNTSAGRLDGVTFSLGSADVPASTGGAARITQTVDQLCPHNHGGVAASAPHKHFIAENNSGAGGAALSATNVATRTINTGGADSNYTLASNNGGAATATVGLTSEVTVNATITSQGGGQAMTVIDPFFTGTIYVKLALPIAFFATAALSALQGGGYA